jgi:hypothetical protein
LNTFTWNHTVAAFVKTAPELHHYSRHNLAAAFIPTRIGTVRHRLRTDFGPRFHWSENTDPAYRHKFLQLLVEFGIDLRAVVARNVQGRATELARARCFGALVADLAAIGGQKLTIDKRETTEKNDRDRRQIDGFIKRGILPKDFQYAFEKPPAEPIIWIADAVAGAVQAQFTAADPQYIEAVQTHLRLRILP